MYDSQTDQEISGRNEARLNDIFPQERDDYLWKRRNVNGYRRKEPMIGNWMCMIGELTGPPPKMTVPCNRVKINR